MKQKLLAGKERYALKQIAIVEDEDASAQTLAGYIQRYAEETGQQFQVTRFADGEAFLERYTPVYAVVFLDIQMPRKDGMTAAQELRNLDRNVSVVFITNLVQYALKGYEVDAVGYLVKPVNYCDFALKFKKALDVYLLNEERSFTINTPGGICRISTDRLMYVEILNHRLFYHMVDGIIERTGALSDVEQELREYGFLRCNKCYLVNPRFVVRVKGYTVQVGSQTLQVSRPRRAAFLAELADWFAGGQGGEQR